MIQILYFLIKKTFSQKIHTILGSIIDFFPVNFLEKKYVFVRADCDHFGPWRCLYLYCLVQEKDLKKNIICLAKEGTISNYWKNYFKVKNLNIVYNPFLKFIISPFFFSKKLAIDVNPQIPIEFFLKGKKYKNFKTLKYISDNILEEIELPPIEDESRNPSYRKLQSRPYILFYGRFGFWDYSTRPSKRNMPIDIFIEIINFIGKTHNIFLIGDSYKAINFKSDFLFSKKSFQSEKINLAYIYKNADSVIGSVSGATHFPSLIFNKPTLYIADIPLHHIYIYYSFKKNWKNNFNIDNLVIPKNDYWVMINLFNYSYSSLSSKQSYIQETEDFSSLERTIYNFLQNNLNKEKIIDRDNFYDLATKQFKKDKDKYHFYSNYGKILIHKKYKYIF